MKRAVAVALAAAAALPVAPAAAGAETVRLSDEKTLSRWAHTRLESVVREEPRGASSGVARLRFTNEDGKPEIYLALRSRIDADGRKWIQIRLPMRPNGTTGWVPRHALYGFHVVETRLVVDKRRLRATLYERGRAVWSARVGVGKKGTPTPTGRFWIRDRLRLSGPGGIYGPLAFGTSAYSVLSDWPGGGVVGIHGTNQPGLIPGRPSHGCIRVRNADILRLGKLMPLGTPVLIR